MITKVRIAITRECQMHCIYCPHGTNFSMEDFSGGQKGPALSLPDILGIVGAMRNHGVTDVHLTGGEPLCRHDVIAMVRALTILGMRVELNTNGILLTTETAEALRDAGLRLLKISLDAPSQSVFKELTGIDCFDRVVNNIRQAAQILPVRINCVVLRRTLSQIPRLIELVSELNASALLLLDLTFYDYEGCHALWNEEFVNLTTELIPTIVAQYGGTFRRLPIYGCSFVELTDSTASTRVMTKEAGISTRGSICANCPVFCHEGIFALRMSVDGYLSPCPNVSEHGVNAMTCLRDKTLDEAMRRYVDLFAASSPGETFGRFLHAQQLRPKSCR